MQDHERTLYTFGNDAFKMTDYYSNSAVDDGMLNYIMLLLISLIDKGRSSIRTKIRLGTRGQSTLKHSLH